MYLAGLASPKPAVPATPAQPTAAVFTPGATPLTQEAELGLRPGDTFRECVDCPEMVVVPTGSFIMGSPPKEEGHTDNEAPQHKVTIPRPFAVGKFEVTRGEFAAFARDSALPVGDMCASVNVERAATR